LLTSIAMFVRNRVILAISPAAASIAIGPLQAMTGGAPLCLEGARERGTEPVRSLHLDSPVSLRHVPNFGPLFELMELLGTMRGAVPGSFGFLALGLLGGTISSASARPEAITAIHGKLSRRGGCGDGVLSIASAPVNLPLAQRQSSDKSLTRRLAAISLLLVAAGFVVLAVRQRIADRGRLPFVVPDRPSFSVSACPQLRDRVHRGLRFL
jgi:uncharacterized membrane protein (DUF4010 family)